MKSQRVQSGLVSGWHKKTTKAGSLGPVSSRFQLGLLQDMGTRAAAGSCVVGVDAEPGLYHQGAVWRAVLALVIWSLVAGLAVAGPLPGRSQVRRASGAESLVATQALDFPRLHASLAGSRTRTPESGEPFVLTGLPLTGLQGRRPG